MRILKLKCIYAHFFLASFLGIVIQIRLPAILTFVFWILMLLLVVSWGVV